MPDGRRPRADGDEHPAVPQNLERARDRRSITSPRRSGSPCCTRPRTTSGSTRTTSRRSASTERVRSVREAQVAADAGARHAEPRRSEQHCRAVVCSRVVAADRAAASRRRHRCETHERRGMNASRHRAASCGASTAGITAIGVRARRRPARRPARTGASAGASRSVDHHTRRASRRARTPSEHAASICSSFTCRSRRCAGSTVFSDRGTAAQASVATRSPNSRSSRVRRSSVGDTAHASGSAITVSERCAILSRTHRLAVAARRVREDRLQLVDLSRVSASALRWMSTRDVFCSRSSRERRRALEQHLPLGRLGGALVLDLRRCTGSARRRRARGAPSRTSWGTRSPRACPSASSSMKRAILSPFFVIISRYWLTMPPIECSPGASRAAPRSRLVRRGRVAHEVAAIAIERVARDVEAERLLLEREQLLGAPDLDLGVASRPCRGARRLPRRRLGAPANRPNSEVCPLRRSRCSAAPRSSARVERREQLRAVVAARQAVERAALDQLLEHAAVALLRVDAPAQLEQRRRTCRRSRAPRGSPRPRSRRRPSPRRGRTG